MNAKSSGPHKSTPKNKKEKLFNRLLEGFGAYTSRFHKKRLRAAFALAERAHEDQFRESGEPYIHHPLEVALILTEYYADEDTLIAALLHDTIEDSAEELAQEIKETFGSHVLQLVEGVTKVEQFTPTNRRYRVQETEEKPQDIETIRKIFQASRKDIRVILIKLADRLHNMGTLSDVAGEEKRRKKAEETLSIFVPVAMRLGIWKMKNDLEKLCLHHLYPKAEQKVLAFCEEIQEEKKALTKKLLHSINQADKKDLITDIFVYERSPYTLKMLYDEKKELQLEDTLNLFICVKNEDDCYLGLKLIHSIWKIRIYEHDYISNPRSNGYRAYHIDVVTERGHRVQIRIGTKEMYLRSMYGISFDVFQKHKKGTPDFLLPFEVLSEKTKDRPGDFLKAAKSDLLKERIEVQFSGKEIFVPRGSTALDAVFYVYGKKALHTKKILLNNREVAFNSALPERKVLEVEFSPVATVDFDWFYKIRTANARITIQEALQKWNYERRVDMGKEILQKEFDLYGKGEVERIISSHKNQIKERLPEWNLKKDNSIYALVGEGSLSPYDVFLACYPETKKNLFQRWVDRANEVMGRFFFRTKKDTFRLKIEVISDKKDQVLKKIDLLAHDFEINVQKSSFSLRERSGIFLVKINCSSVDRRNFHNFWTYLEQEEGVIKVLPVLSLRRQGLVIFWSFLAVLSWLTLPILFHGQEGSIGRNLSQGLDTLTIYISLIPILALNYILYNLIKNYYVQVRNTRWMMFIGLLLNFLAILFFAQVLFLDRQAEHTILVPLALFLISSLFISLEYSSRSLGYKHHTFIGTDTQDWKSKLRQKIAGYGFRIGAILFFGATPVVVKYFLKGMDGATVTSAGFLLAALLVSPLALYKIWKKDWGKPSSYSQAFWLSVIFDGLMLIFYFFSVRFTYASHSVLFLNFAPVIGIIFALLFHQSAALYLQKKKEARNIIILFLVGAVGTCLLMVNQGMSSGADYQYKLLGDLMGLGAMIVDVIATVALIMYTKSKQAFSGFDYILRKVIVLAILFSPIAIYSFFTQKYTLNLDMVFGLGYVSLCYILLGYWFAYEAFRRIDGYISYMLINLAPLVTLVLEVVYFGFPLTTLFIWGGVLILGSAIGAECINSKCAKKYLQGK